ncbi:flagellar export chaperone FliS [Pseudorhodoferax sp. LjRoot39]|uniref:flagellar export chaperone FliS n=1 Tax=Pseudorhodoferax sp. LjRoot39 TaxID=3342328 RepID=UPI003F4F9703
MGSSMFTSVSSRSAAAYKRVGTQTSVEGASPHQLICLLYEALLAALRQAHAATMRGDIETKGKEIGKAVRIIDEGLKAALNDAAGGELATNLRGVYNYSISRLTRANIHNDAPMIQEVIDLIVPVYGAWKSIATPAGQAASS